MSDKVTYYDKLTSFEDDLAWLELSHIPDTVYNYFIDNTENYNLDPAEEMVKLCMDQDYLHFTCKHLLNVNLLPFQILVLKQLWTRKMPMLIGCRGSGKSFILAVYALLRALLQPGAKVVIVGAAFRQSKIIFDYIDTIWQHAPILRDIVGTGKYAGPRRETDRCYIKIGESVVTSIPIGDGSKVRGLRASHILADEFASISEEVFNVVIRGFGIVASDPVSKVKEQAKIQKLKDVGGWTDELKKAYYSQSEGNQIVYSGTAYYTFNHFYKYYKVWKMIIESCGDQEVLDGLSGEFKADTSFNWRELSVMRIPYTAVPL
jgi:hypothetical protein